MKSYNIKKYLPNIIYLGPDKSGSSWLYFIFSQHPDIFVPSIKDIYFFDKNYERGIEWYISFFKNKNKERFACDISHDYLFSETAANRIKTVYQNYNQNVFLITNLRDPIEKLWSHYLFLIRSGITREPIEKAIENYPELLNESLYYKHVKVYKKLFGDQYKIFLFDNLKKDPKQFALNLFENLNINFYENINYYENVLPASKPRSFYLAKFSKIGANYLRKKGYLKLLGYLKKNKLINHILFTSYKKKPSISDDITFKLWNMYFKEDVKKLSDLIKIDLLKLWGYKYE